MTTKTTLRTIVAYLKSRDELPKLLEIKHYAKILQKNGEYKKINHSLNALSKALGYRKFGDINKKLEDTGSIVNFRFEINEKASLEMPYTLTLNCEVFINDTYENIYSNLEMQPWVIISKDGIKIQYMEDLVLNLLYVDLEYTPQEYVFFNEHKVVEFDESMIPLKVEDLHKTLEVNYEARIKEVIEPSVDKNENGDFLKHMSNILLVKPLSKTRYSGGIMISDYINKDLTIDMDITFGSFNTDIEAEIYSNAAKAVFINNGVDSRVEITSKGKSWIVSDKNIVFKRLKEEKKKLMGRPLNPMDGEDFKILKESLNENSPYHEIYNIDSENDLEIVDYSLSELSKHLKDGFDFQVLAYYSEEIKKKKTDVKNINEIEITINDKEFESKKKKFNFTELETDCILIEEYNSFTNDFEIVDDSRNFNSKKLQDLKNFLTALKSPKLKDFERSIQNININDFILFQSLTSEIASLILNLDNAYFNKFFEANKNIIINAEFIEIFVDLVIDKYKAEVLLNYINDDKDHFAKSLAASAISKNKKEIIMYLVNKREIDLKNVLIESINSSLGYIPIEMKIIKSIDLLIELNVIDSNYIYNFVIPKIEKFEVQLCMNSTVKEYFIRLNELK